MDLPEENALNNHYDGEQPKSDTKPNAYRVDEDGTDEASLRKNYIIGGDMKNANAPGMEGEGMGGHNFGGANHPPTGDDPANPSQNAGYTNGYFAKTEPSVEVTENNNFKAQSQQGEPDYQQSRSATPNEQQEQSAGEQGNTSTPGEANFKEEDLHGPDYGSNAPEIPGPSELPDQQKVGGA